MDIKKYLAEKKIVKTDAGYLLQDEDIELIDKAFIDAEEANQNASELISQQAEQLASFSESGSATIKAFELGVTFKKKSYVIVKNRIKLAGDAKVYSAEEVSNSPGLIEQIIKMDGQKLIIPV